MKKIGFTILIGILTIFVSNIYALNISSNVKYKGIIKGKVVESESGTPLEYATVSLYKSLNDSLIGGTVSSPDGHFLLKNVKVGKYYIKLSFIGFGSKSIPDVVISKDNYSVDLGVIKLQSGAEEIGEAVVTAEKPGLIFNLDKKILNVDQFKLPASANAIDALRNFPSVEIGIGGTVLLRGSSNFKVLVDDKPSIFEPEDILRQIPANSIDKIEIITNPSAKYDSEGVAGIINIVTKRKLMEGINGRVNLSGGNLDNYGADVLFSVKKEKTAFFVGISSNQRGIEGKMNYLGRNTRNDTVYSQEANNNYDYFQGVTGARLGFDYDFNKNNSVSIQLKGGQGKDTRLNDKKYNQYSSPVSIANSFNTQEDYYNKDLSYSFDFNYKHRFNDKKGHQLSFLFYNNVIQTKNKRNSQSTDNNLSLLDGYSDIEKKYPGLTSVKMDYTLPLGEKSKFETGIKLEISEIEIDNEAKQYNPLSGQYEILPSFINNVNFKRDIYSAYATFSSGIQKFNYMLGLRTEYTDRDIDVTETSEQFDNEYLDFFPSVHLSYNLHKRQDVMLSYSRRIYRPEEWRLKPYQVWRDPNNLAIGNPSLEPSYTNSFEVSYKIGLGVTNLSLDVYYRETNQDIEVIKTIQENNIYIDSYKNSGTTKTLGSDLYIQSKPLKWWRFSISSGLYKYEIDGNFENTNITKNSLNWNISLSNTFNITKTTKAIIDFRYYTPSVTLQGKIKERYMSWFELQQTFLKNFSASFLIFDPFHIYKIENEYSGNNYYINRYIKFNAPTYTFTLTYTFNNYKYDRKKHQRIDVGESEPMW